MKRSLYLSERLDKDVLQELDLDSIASGDFSLEVKKLMRDGIKWRRGGDTDVKERKSVYIPESKVDFEGIQLKKKEISQEDLESKLDLL